MPRLIDRATLFLAAARRHGPLIGVRYVSRRGDRVEIPVQAARRGERLVVAVGRASDKSWWRHFARPAPAEVLVERSWRPAVGVVLEGDADAAARGQYAERFVRVPLDAGTRMIEFTLTDSRD